MPVTATLKLVLRDLPETRERDGLVYMALQNEPRGLPKGITPGERPAVSLLAREAVEDGVHEGREIRASGTPALLIVEAHVSTRKAPLVGVVKGVQVVEGKATAAAPTA